MEGKIYGAIAAVMADVGAVGKDATNTFDRYKYRSIDAVMNAMHPAMAKHNVFVTPEVLEQTREERTSKKGDPMVYSITKVRYTFYTVDGSQVTATVIGEGMDRGDKSMNKAMSAAFKYALFQVFCIPTEEMVDSETDSPEPKAQLQLKETEELQRFAKLRTAIMRHVNENKPPEKIRELMERAGGDLANMTQKQCESYMRANGLMWDGEVLKDGNQGQDSQHTADVSTAENAGNH